MIRLPEMVKRALETFAGNPSYAGQKFLQAQHPVFSRELRRLGRGLRHIVKKAFLYYPEAVFRAGTAGCAWTQIQVITEYINMVSPG